MDGLGLYVVYMANKKTINTKITVLIHGGYFCMPNQNRNKRSLYSCTKFCCIILQKHK